MKAIALAALMLVPYSLSIAATKPKPAPQPDTKPNCLPYYPCCPPSDPNGCGIFDGL